METCANFSPFNLWNKMILHNSEVYTFYTVCVADENVCIIYTYIKLHYIHKQVIAYRKIQHSLWKTHIDFVCDFECVVKVNEQ